MYQYNLWVLWIQSLHLLPCQQTHLCHLGLRKFKSHACGWWGCSLSPRKKQLESLLSTVFTVSLYFRNRQKIPEGLLTCWGSFVSIPITQSLTIIVILTLLKVVTIFTVASPSSTSERKTPDSYRLFSKTNSGIYIVCTRLCHITGINKDTHWILADGTGMIHFPSDATGSQHSQVFTPSQCAVYDMNKQCQGARERAVWAFITSQEYISGCYKEDKSPCVLSLPNKDMLNDSCL